MTVGKDCSRATKMISDDFVWIVSKNSVLLPQ